MAGGRTPAEGAGLARPDRSWRLPGSFWSPYLRESVHLAVTSPPYNVRIAYRGYEDDLPPEAYLQWLKEVWRALYRVLVPEAGSS